MSDVPVREHPSGEEFAAERIVVEFGGLVALNEASLVVPPATAVGLVGPNGSGKSTMLGVLSGLLRPTRGRVRLGERDLSHLPPFRRARLGIARTFQRLELWSSMTVEENIRTGAEFAARWVGDLDVAAETARSLELTGLASLKDRMITELSSGQGRIVEVARALAQRPAILLLDEPTAGLSEAETDRLTSLLGDVVDEGTALVLVEHHVEMVMKLCSQMTVLEFGKVIASGPPEQVRNEPAVREVYLGERYATRS